MAKLTKAQYKYLDDKMQKEIERITQVGSTFQLDNFGCQTYFNVTNETMHRPSCRIEKIEGDKAFVRAVFFGSGIASHPTRYGWVPLSVIKRSVYPSLLTIWYFELKNKVFKPSKEEF